MPSDPWSGPHADPWSECALRKDPWGEGALRKSAEGRNARTPQLPQRDNAWQGYKQSFSSAPQNNAPSNGHNYTHNRRVKYSSRGERVEVIDWQGLEIVPVQKDFSFEHPGVAARSEDECEAIRAKNSIHVLKSPPDEPMPRPLVRFEEAPFPDWASAELRRNGFEKPTPIQVQAWPVVLKGHDFVGIAETGSGRTISYVLPMLVHIMAQPELRPGEGPIGVVLVPTCESCMQVSQQVDAFTASTRVICRGLHGGEEIDEQTRDKAQRVDIAVVTPGLLIALLNHRLTNLRRATFIVLDEADQLLGNNFGDQVRLILGQVRPDRQALLFSSTWPATLEGLAAEVCHHKPIHVNVDPVSLSSCKAITQRLHFVCPGESKHNLLCLALGQIKHALSIEGVRALVFCNRPADVQPLAEKLQQRGYRCEGFHAEQTQAQREEVLNRFSKPECSIWLLVCTQIPGNTNDFHNVRYVINYDMPGKVVEYIHRIGKTSKVGQRGFSLTFLTESDLPMSKDLVPILRESQQEVPTFLLNCRQHRRRSDNSHPNGRAHHGRPYSYTDIREQDGHRSGSVLEDGGNSRGGRGWGGGGWGGRGRGRREFYLARCSGTGPARPSRV